MNDLRKWTAGQIPSSILICVIGFPAGSYIGFACTSIFDIAKPGNSAPDIFGVSESFWSFSTLVAGAFASSSVVVFVWLARFVEIVS